MKVFRSKGVWLIGTALVLLGLYLLWSSHERSGQSGFEGDLTEESAEAEGVASVREGDDAEAVKAGEEGVVSSVLSLRFNGAAVELVAGYRMPGAAKRPRLLEKAGNLYFRMLNAEGDLTWESTSPDPRIYHFDTIDEDGTFFGGMERVENAAFLLTLPEVSQGDVLEIFDYTKGAEPKLLLRSELRL